MSWEITAGKFGEVIFLQEKARLSRDPVEIICANSPRLRVLTPQQDAAESSLIQTTLQNKRVDLRLEQSQFSPPACSLRVNETNAPGCSVRCFVTDELCVSSLLRVSQDQQVICRSSRSVTFVGFFFSGVTACRLLQYGGPSLPGVESVIDDRKGAGHHD